MRSRLHLLVLTAAFFTVASCASLKNSVIVTPDQVPADFKAYKDTLLVLNDKVIIGYGKYLKKNFEQYYKGKYKIISRNEYLNGPGNNFRYVFTAQSAYEGAGPDAKTMIQYIILDNKTGKQYKTPQTRYYSELMINYIKELNARLGK